MFQNKILKAESERSLVKLRICQEGTKLIWNEHFQIFKQTSENFSRIELERYTKKNKQIYWKQQDGNRTFL